MVPYIHLSTYHLGPVPIDPWGLLVTIGFVLGLEVARARGIEKGLDVRDVVDGVVFTVLAGFVVGHLVHVLAYHPEKYEKDGIASLYRVWEGFSSFGGFLGALLGNVLFYRVIRKRSWLAHADVVMFAFPFAWIFGRAGCAIVHDHIGRPTTFPLAVNFDAMLEGMGCATTSASTSACSPWSSPRCSSPFGSGRGQRGASSCSGPCSTPRSGSSWTSSAG